MRVELQGRLPLRACVQMGHSMIESDLLLSPLQLPLHKVDPYYNLVKIIHEWGSQGVVVQNGGMRELAAALLLHETGGV